MEQVQKLGYGFTDDTDDSLKSKAGVKFGLNQGSFLTKFAYNPNAGKDGAEANAIDISVMTGDREQNLRIYEVTRVFGKDGEITDTSSEEYIKNYNATQIQNSAVITHILKAFRSEEDIKAALATPPTSFADWAKIVTGLMPAGFEKTPIDVFYEYQWEIKGDNDRTYLQLPKNMKGGYFICPAQKGTFKEVRTETGGLTYVNEQGQEHPFTRDAGYMDSPKANQQVEGQEASAIAGGASAPAASTW